MKAVVTGSGGFIGGHLTSDLLSRGWEVLGIDNLSTGLQETVDKHLEYNSFTPIYLDIADADHVIRISSAVNSFDPDYIFHLAAIPGVATSVSDPVRANRVNVTGTINMLDITRRCNVKRFIFSSSSSIYGGISNGIISENCSLHPKSPYALQKKIGEEYCSLFSNLYGIETISLRYFNVFGPRQRFDSNYSAVMPAFCNSLLWDQAPTIYGSGKQSRDFCYVDNVVYANILAATSNCVFMGDAFNIGCGERTSVIELCDMLGTKKPVFEPSRSGDVMHSHADISKATKIMGYKPKVLLKEGIEITKKWFLDNVK